MASMHASNALYSGRPGGLDIEWPRNAYFHMSALLPWDISSVTFIAGLTNRSGENLALMTVSGTVYGTTSGIITCTMDETLLTNLPSSSLMYINQIEDGHTYPKLAGTFTLLEKGDA